MNAATKQLGMENVGQEARQWFEKLARLGYASRGVIYVIIGVLALMAAVGQGGQTLGTKEAIDKLLDAPGGRVLVLAVALGLAGYSAWRFCQSVFDADHHGNDGNALVVRGALLVSGITHGFLSVWAFLRAFGYAWGGASKESEKSLVETLMSQAFGHWIVGAIGLALIGAGVTQFYRGYKERFARYFHWTAEHRRKLRWFCIVGLFARGVVFAIIGSFIVYAAITTNPANAVGLRDALGWLNKQWFGYILLPVMAAGLISFGINSFVEAAFRRIRAPL